MLQQGRVAHAVRVAEVEEAGAHQSAQGAALRQVHAPHGAGLAVGHVEQLAVRGQATGLVEPAHQGHAVAQLLAATARVQHQILLLRAVTPDLVLAGHGYVELLVGPQHVPGRVHAARGGCTAASEEVLLLAGAGHRLYGALRQVHQPDAVVAGVRHVEHVPPRQRHALRRAEGGGLERAVLQPRLAVADHVQYLALEVRDHDAVVPAVGYEQPATQRVRQHVAREAQWRPRRSHGAGVQLEWRAVQRAALVEHLHHARDDLVEQVVDALALVPPQDVALGVDEDEAGPRPDAVLAPDVEGGVVHYGLGASVALGDQLDVGGLRLVVELGRMHPDDHQFVLVLGHQRLQVGDDVDAVDAAVGPEIQQHHLAAQLLQRQGAVRVDPVQAGWELRRGRAAHERLGGARGAHQGA